MRVKTNDLSGAALDWAVAKALGYDPKVKTWSDIIATLDPEEDADLIAFHTKQKTVRVRYSNPVPGTPCPKFSTDWSKAGEIIQRERIDVAWCEEGWYANMYWRGLDVIPAAAAGESFRCGGDGPTPLIAAMRCYVASRLGDEVDLPEELL